MDNRLLTKNFTNYLKRKGISEQSRASYNAQVNHYLQWLEKDNLEIIQTTNTDVLGYMKYCSRKGNSQRTIQNKLVSIDHYYNHLQKETQIHHNPIKGIEIKGVKRNTLYHILEPLHLNNIYQSYPTSILAQKRNKVILGLLVYQGLRTEELGKLTTKDIKMREGKITVPRGRKHNERVLKLESHQVLDMYDYMLQARPKLVTNPTEEKLFINPSGSSRFNIIMRPIIKWLKEKHKTGSLNQIRASVITKWLKTYNLREAQYLAGHRYISSTEHYLQNDLEGLSEEINKYHPLQ